MTQENEFKVIETQEQLNSVIKNRVDREREKYTEEINQLKTENADLKKQVSDLTDTVNESNTTIDDMKSQIKEKDDKIEGFTIDQMKYDLAFEYGIPRNMSKRLQGGSYEEIEADAKEMAKTFENLRPDPPTRSTEPTEILSGLDAGYARMADNLVQGE